MVVVCPVVFLDYNFIVWNGSHGGLMVSVIISGSSGPGSSYGCVFGQDSLITLTVQAYFHPGV